MLRSGNPSLRRSTFRNVESSSLNKSMTLDGVVRKSLILLILLVGSAAFSWNLYVNEGNMLPLIFGSAIGGFIVALITIFVPKASPITGPLYALLEGLLLGAISAQYAFYMDGIVMQAIILTLCVFFVMLTLYATKVIRPTRKFKNGVMIATGAIALAYLLNFILRLFGSQIPFIHDAGPIGIIISLVIVGVAAMNLILDFDFIKSAASSAVPKYMEWYASFTLMVTLVWLYLEILRLLSKLKRR